MDSAHAAAGIHSAQSYILPSNHQRTGRTLPPPAESSNHDRWTEALPLALLGIHTALKTDIGCSTAELVFGTTLRLPGELFDPDASSSVREQTSYVTRLKTAMEKLRAVPPREQHARQSHISHDL